MKNFEKITPEELSFDPIPEIGKRWMLISARKPNGKINAMTASWGGTGVLWNKPVAFLFVRPQRYTKEFLDASGNAALSFFEEKYRPALTLCGRKSGRDCDKIGEAGLTVRDFDGCAAFEEASLVLTLKKLYVGRLEEGCFFDRETAEKNYPNKDWHFVYICEILNGYRA